MRIGIITGSGTYALPDFAGARAVEVAPSSGRAGHRGALRRRRGPARLAPCRRPPAALQPGHPPGQHRRAARRGADAILAVTVCGAVDPTVALGSLIVFDDLHFLVNRLADGSICTLHTEPGEPAAGTGSSSGPSSPAAARGAARRARSAAGLEARDGGCYGHVDGPRFNTKRRDPDARRRRRDGGQPDRGAGDRAGRRGRDPVRAARLRDRLRQRRRRTS